MASIMKEQIIKKNTTVNNNNRITTIIITSYVNSHPETDLLEQVVLSLNHIELLNQGNIIIVFDGYKISKDLNTWKTKKGLITTEQAERYEQYYLAVKKLYENRRQQIQLLKLPKYSGFAFGVRTALLKCKTKYAMIVQHDRIFTDTFKHTNKLIDLIEKYNHIKYIGFPSIKSQTHHILLTRKYRLNDFSNKCKIKIIDNGNINNNNNNNNTTNKKKKNDADDVVVIDDDDGGITSSTTMIKQQGHELYLQPCIFWYDSNHLCHVERYLQIYAPYLKLFNENVLNWLGNDFNVNKLKLKNGDFIEDKFGQFQRNMLYKLKEKQNEKEYIELFQTFGSYLIYDIDHMKDNVRITTNSNRNAPIKRNPCEFSNKELNLPKIFVQHLRGRQYDRNSKNNMNKSVFGHV